MSLSIANNGLSSSQSGNFQKHLPVQIHHVPPPEGSSHKPLPLPGLQFFKGLSNATCSCCGQNHAKADQESKILEKKCREESEKRSLETFKSSFEPELSTNEELDAIKERLRILSLVSPIINNTTSTQPRGSYPTPLPIRVGYNPLLERSFLSPLPFPLLLPLPWPDGQNNTFNRMQPSTMLSTVNNTFTTQPNGNYMNPLSVRVGYNPSPGGISLPLPPLPWPDDRNTANEVEELKTQEEKLCFRHENPDDKKEWNDIDEMIKQYSNNYHSADSEEMPTLPKPLNSNIIPCIERFRDQYLCRTPTQK